MSRFPLEASSNRKQLYIMVSDDANIDQPISAADMQAAMVPVFNNTATRSIVTSTSAGGLQISPTRLAFVSYSVTIIAAATGLVGGASHGYVVLEVCPTNSITAGDWQEIGRWTNGQTFTSLLTLTSSQPVGFPVSAFIPPGYYTRLRSVNVAGTPSFTFTSGQEMLF